MNKLESTISKALETTEANGLVLGHTTDNATIFCFPMWEAESEVDVIAAALQCAVRWADDNGQGELRVSYGFRDDTIDIT
jgi:hypothetical protein